MNIQFFLAVPKFQPFTKLIFNSLCRTMTGTSLVNLAKRALVTLLIAFARQCQVPGVGVNRESPDTVVMGAFKKVARRVHPDKGGSTADSAKLNSARDKWEEASAATTALLRPTARTRQTTATQTPKKV